MLPPARTRADSTESDQSLLSASSLDARDRKLPRPSKLSVGLTLSHYLVLCHV